VGLSRPGLRNRNFLKKEKELDELIMSPDKDPEGGPKVGDGSVE